MINDGITPAVGEVTYLTGRILDAKGDPVRNALVEIWQVDNNGAYIHTKDPHGEKHDKNFQGFGRFLTGSTGEYYFRTIKPVLYTGRTRHIHFKIKRGSKELLTTQCYVKGEPANERDGIYREHPRPEGPRVGHDRLRSDRRLADRRAGGKLRRRARVHARGMTSFHERSRPRNPGQRTSFAGSVLAQCSFARFNAVNGAEKMRVLHVEPLEGSCIFLFLRKNK